MASTRIMNQLNDINTPLLYVIGPQSNISALNTQRTPVKVSPYNQAGMNEAVPVFNDGFSLFKLSAALQELIPFMPPLNTHFATYDVQNVAGMLFFQKIGSIESTDPLWILEGTREKKVSVICGTGLWKWRMKTWQETGDHKLFNELINKTIQFLAVREDKRRFRVVAKENIAENAAVEIKAELYNESYEAVNEPDVRLEIMDESNNVYEYIFNKTEDAYTLNAGNFAVGTYTYRASARLAEQVFTDEGGFTVSPVIAEQASLRAAHELLQALAEDNGGTMLTTDRMEQMTDILKQRGDVRPVIHSEKKFVEFIDIWWVLIVILALLGAEWFLRKWSGSY
jgi:hypothetical protein